jgi:3-(3-hydroxy-phenyl)propionate hydroxylase
VLVVTDELSGQQRQRVTERGVRLVEAPQGSALRSWLDSGHATAALVRPDYTVVRAGRDFASLIDSTPRFAAAVA